MRELVAARIYSLLEWIEQRDWMGFDPYDGLRTLPFNPSTPRLRQLQVQAVKRFPFDLRRCFGAQTFVMSKSLALGLMAMGELGEQERATSLQSRLLERRLENGLWGYEFDVQTRWGFYPAGSPNVIVSSFAIHALVDTMSEEKVEILEASTEALVSHFLEPAHSGPFFRYTDDSKTLIHNANMLAAAAVARASRRLGNEEWEEIANNAATTSIACQSPAGSWPYGELRNLRWVDGLHTAYVLIALDWLAIPGTESSLDKGLTFYRNRLFTNEHRPLARADGRRGGDIHDVATAIWALSRLAKTRSELDHALRVLPWIERLRKPDGSYRMSATNRVSYMRWGQAHTLLGLAAFKDALEEL